HLVCEISAEGRSIGACGAGPGHKVRDYGTRGEEIIMAIERGAGLRLGVLVSYLRQEEKLILAAARAREIVVTPIFDRNLTLNLSAPNAAASGLDIDVLLDRSVVHSRAGYTLWAMNRWGIPTLNTAAAVTI